MNKDVFRKLRQMLMEELDLSRELSDKEILDVIDELILNQIKDVRLALKEKVQLRQELFYSVRKLDVLQELVDDETVTEIMVNGPDTIFVERAGKLMKWHKSFTSAEKLEDVIQQIVGKCNRVINESMPIVDARLENGSRVNAVIYPVALNGKADRTGKYHTGMCRISGEACEGQIFHGHRRRNRKRKDYISCSNVGIYPQGRKTDHNRR